MGAILEGFPHASLGAIVAATFLIALALATRFVLNNSGIYPYPGPIFARVSDLWLAWHTARGTVNKAVWNAHRVYGAFSPSRLYRRVMIHFRLSGPLVRIAPNHISIADVSALQTIYGHKAGLLKSDFYEVFTSFNGRKSIFSTRSREEHTRKRRILSHTFSQRSTLEFEPVVQHHLTSLIKQWDHMCSEAAGGRRGITGDMTWATTHEGHAVFDVLKCERARSQPHDHRTQCLKGYNFMIFDVIGRFSFFHGAFRLTHAKNRRSGLSSSVWHDRTRL